MPLLTMTEMIANLQSRLKKGSLRYEYTVRNTMGHEVLRWTNMIRWINECLNATTTASVQTIRGESDE